MNESERQLVDLYLDGELPEAECSALLERLETDPQAVAYLAERTLLLSDLRRSVKRRNLQQWAVASTVEQRPHLGTARSHSRFPWLQWRPLTAAAAGVVLGVFSGSLVYAHFNASTAEVVPLTNAGFESGPEPTNSGIVAAFDRWGGDLCRVVPAEQGITPHEGARMLRFLSAVSQGAPEAKDFTVADQWLLLDVRALPLQGDARTVALSARFNRTADSTAANNRFGVGLYAFRGTAADGPKLWHNVKARALAFAETEVPTDSDPATWERGETRLTIPADADLLLLRIHAFKQHWRDTATPELIGHYADDVRLEIIPTKQALP